MTHDSEVVVLDQGETITLNPGVLQESEMPRYPDTLGEHSCMFHGPAYLISVSDKHDAVICKDCLKRKRVPKGIRTYVELSEVCQQGEDQLP